MLIAADWCRSLLIAAEYADGCSKLNEGRTLVCQMKLWNTSTIVWVDIICVSKLPNLDLKFKSQKGILFVYYRNQWQRGLYVR